MPEKSRGNGMESMTVFKAIQTKRAVRQFEDRPVPDEHIRAIVNAGRRAQSSKNTQPWQFIVVRDKGILSQLAETGRYAGHLAGAAFAVAILTPDPDQRWSILFDAGQAAAYMQLAAWSLGIGSVLAAIHEPDKARSILKFPAELHLHAAISFGYPADVSVLDTPARAGGRKPFDEVVHWDRFGGRA